MATKGTARIGAEAAPFTETLLEHYIRISMDDRGFNIDNIFTGRLWRSVKYEKVYLKAYKGVPETGAGPGSYQRSYEDERPHQSLEYRTGSV